MRKLCERPGCSSPAEVSYGIDNSRLLVWIDNRAPTSREHVGRLCRRHADKIVVPRGWTLDDRRNAVPRLFNAAQIEDLSGGSDRPAPREPSRPTRRPRVDPSMSSPSLFDAPRQVAPSGSSPEPVDGVELDGVPGPTEDRGAVAPVEAVDGDDRRGAARDNTTTWLLRLAGPVEDDPEEDEQPEMGRLLGRAFGRAIGERD